MSVLPSVAARLLSVLFRELNPGLKRWIHVFDLNLFDAYS